MSRPQLWSRLSHVRSLQHALRFFSTSRAARGHSFSLPFRPLHQEEDVEHVTIPCASSGHITIGLYNVRQHSPTVPLLLHLPPFPDADPSSPPSPPSFLLEQSLCPVASIHYRWSATPPGSDGPHLLWPTPLHDVLFAHDWLSEHYGGRLFFAYGSRLGAGLAASLALTETRYTPSHLVGLDNNVHAPGGDKDARTGMRGFAGHDGIYNWTGCVTEQADSADLFVDPLPGMPSPCDLFPHPRNLLDSFASPSLFFRMPGGLLIPESWEEDDALLAANEDDEKARKSYIHLFHPPRTSTSYHRFPPNDSSLIIPAALLMHEAGAAEIRAADIESDEEGKAPRLTCANNSYALQAAELAGLMRYGLSNEVFSGRATRYSDYITGYNKIDIATKAHEYIRLVDVDSRKEAADTLLAWLGDMTVDVLYER